VDAVVTDLAMPGRDGFALLAELRARDATKALPVLALTAFAAMEDRRRSMDAGFTAHLPKPVHGPALIAALCDALSN
jgi:CheY-like chemotaxis protein